MQESLFATPCQHTRTLNAMKAFLLVAVAMAVGITAKPILPFKFPWKKWESGGTKTGMAARANFMEMYKKVISKCAPKFSENAISKPDYFATINVGDAISIIDGLIASSACEAQSLFVDKVEGPIPKLEGSLGDNVRLFVKTFEGLSKKGNADYFKLAMGASTKVMLDLFGMSISQPDLVNHRLVVMKHVFGPLLEMAKPLGRKRE